METVPIESSVVRRLKKRFNLAAVQVDEDKPSGGENLAVQIGLDSLPRRLQIILDKGEVHSLRDNVRSFVRESGIYSRCFVYVRHGLSGIASRNGRCSRRGCFVFRNSCSTENRTGTGAVCLLIYLFKQEVYPEVSLNSRTCTNCITSDICISFA